MLGKRIKLSFLNVSFINICFLFYVLQTNLLSMYLFLFLYLSATIFLYIAIKREQNLKAIAYKKSSQKEKLTLLGQMSLNIVHEIRNPLTTIKGFTTLLNNKLMDNELSFYCQLMLQEVDSINNIISAFYRYAKPQPPDFKILSLDKIISDFKATIDSKCQENNVTLLYNLNSNTKLISADLEQIQEVILNLVQNSIEALETKSGGEIEISTSYCPLTEEVILQIRDNGQGMSREEQLLAETPFYSLKDNSIGLGLSICYQLIREHNGHIDIHSSLNNGTEFSVFLPSVIQKE